MNGIVKKHKIALYLGVKDKTTNAIKWTRYEKSEALEVSANPEVKEYNYIADEYPTKELDHYNISIAQSLVMFKGNPDYEIMFPRFFAFATGEEAKAPCLLVYYQEPRNDDATQFLAHFCPSALFVINSLSAVDGTISFDINFNGEIQQGYVTKDATTGDITFTQSSGQ